MSPSRRRRGIVGAKPWQSTRPADGKCQLCGKKMRLTHTLAAEFPGTVRYGGKGRCQTCANAQRKRIEDPDHGTRGPSTATPRSAEEVLEDWVIIRDRLGGLDRMAGYLLIGRAARDLGMSYAALDKALERARIRGDARGNLRCFDRATVRHVA